MADYEDTLNEIKTAPSPVVITVARAVTRTTAAPVIGVDQTAQATIAALESELAATKRQLDAANSTAIAASAAAAAVAGAGVANQNAQNNNTQNVNIQNVQNIQNVTLLGGSDTGKIKPCWAIPVPCCCVTSYTFTDCGCGCSSTQTCCCNKCINVCCMSQSGDHSDGCCICVKCDWRCVGMSTCLKSATTVGCGCVGLDTRCAFPCDKDVPFLCTICCCTICGCECACRERNFTCDTAARTPVAIDTRPYHLCATVAACRTVADGSQRCRACQLCATFDVARASGGAPDVQEMER